MAVRASAAKRGIAEEMRALLEEPNKDGSTKRKVLAAKLVMNMDKSPEWYKLGLRMLGELPPEQVDVRNSVLSADAKADLDRLLAEQRMMHGDARGSVAHLAILPCGHRAHVRLPRFNGRFARAVDEKHPVRHAGLYLAGAPAEL